jgi:hypothetical protein
LPERVPAGLNPRIAGIRSLLRAFTTNGVNGRGHDRE